MEAGTVSDVVQLLCCPYHRQVLTHDVVAEEWRCPSPGCLLHITDDAVSELFGHG